MDTESFTALALRVLSGEGNADDRKALEGELSTAPGRRPDFEELKLTYEILRATAPMTEAVRATAPELPAHRFNEVRRAVRQHFGPAGKRPEEATGSRGWAFVLRWIFGGSGIAALGFALVIFCFANREIEIGLYADGPTRGGGQSLSGADISSARFMTFEQDAQFDQWQSRPLSWNEHAKVWIDNEHDLLHIVRRVRSGQVVTETKPLAPTDEGQREQVEQVVESLRN